VGPLYESTWCKNRLAPRPMSLESYSTTQWEGTEHRSFARNVALDRPAIGHFAHWAGGMEWIVYLRRCYWGSGPSAAWSRRAGGPPPTATTCSCGGGAGVSDRKEAGVPKQEWPTPNLKTSFNFFVHTF
jgi:hypothetical protein